MKSCAHEWRLVGDISLVRVRDLRTFECLRCQGREDRSAEFVDIEQEFERRHAALMLDTALRNVDRAT